MRLATVRSTDLYSIPLRRLPTVVAVLLFSFLLFTGCGRLDEAQTHNQMGETRPPLSDRFGFLVGKPGEAARTAQMGAGWIRPRMGPFVWNEIEPAPGKWSFDRADALVTEAQTLGLRTLGTLFSYADWDQRRCHTSS